MPNIQDSRQFIGYSSSVISPVSGMPPVTLRTFSTGSSVSGANGSHSPHSNHTGNCHSPSSMSVSSVAQQLPPACGARQLSKLKRFLTTLQQFGMDISPEIGEHVRGLVLALVNSHLTVEEFHAKLQKATNFPLRPFVIPFLKANLPLLQRELLHCAHLARQSPHQYLIHNERLVFDADNQSPLTAQDLSEIGEKRKSPDRPKEKPARPEQAGQPLKRPCIRSPVTSANLSAAAAPSTLSAFSVSGSEPCRYEDVSLVQDLREINRVDREHLEIEASEKNQQMTSSRRGMEHITSHVDKMERELKHIENMLGCIVEMVDKCKSAINGLREQWQPCNTDRLSYWMHPSDSLAFRSEDAITEVNRRAAEAVNEVKRKALLELEKAVAESEAKAGQLLATERAKMEVAVTEARKQAMEEMILTFNSQQESTETCWNCGRKASETCSGCNVARYCGSFCQHKDWEHHHKACGQMQSSSPGITTSGRLHLEHLSDDHCTGSRPSSPPDPLESIQDQLNEKDQTAPSGNSALRSSPLDIVKCELLN